MKLPNLDSDETATGIERALSHARRLAENAARRGLKPEELAAELKLKEDAHIQWKASVAKYRQILAWYQQLTPEEQSNKVGNIAKASLEHMGEVLFLSKVVGY